MKYIEPLPKAFGIDIDDIREQLSLSILCKYILKKFIVLQKNINN